ncbi:MAG: hypothetical protein ACE366_24075 [Bradymonadia bacterium]
MTRMMKPMMICVALAGCADGQLESAEAPAKETLQALAGTTPDGQLTLDDHGRLRIDEELYTLFDYVLTAEGEAGPEALADKVEQLALTMVPPEAAEEAASIFTRYLTYRQGVAEALSRWHGAPEPPTWEEVQKAHGGLLAELGTMPANMVNIQLESLARSVEIRQVLDRVGADPLDRRAAVKELVAVWLPPGQTQSLGMQLASQRDAAAEVRLKALEADRVRWREKFTRWQADPASVVLTPSELRRAQVWAVHGELME